MSPAAASARSAETPHHLVAVAQDSTHASNAVATLRDIHRWMSFPTSTSRWALSTLTWNQASKAASAPPLDPPPPSS